MSLRNSFDLPSFDWDCSRPLIEMRGIDKSFKTTAGDVQVLKTIHVDFQCGQFVSVVGRSGSGKSTLVNMLTGIDHPTRGSVRVADKLIHQMSESNMSGWRGRNLGIVFQFFQLLPMLSLLENVMLPMDFCNLYPPAEREKRALGLLSQVGLAEFAHKMPGAVAGGQQQSVAVARALANDPPILIADEPTGNLDGRTAVQVMELFEEQVSLGKTVIMVTHDRDLARQAGRMLVIVDGELVNEIIPQAFPEMRHRHLLELSHHARLMIYPAGAPITLAAVGSENLYLIQSGELLAASPLLAGNPNIFRPADWFTQAWLTGLGDFTLQAGPTGLELLEINAPGVPLPSRQRSQP